MFIRFSAAVPGLTFFGKTDIIVQERKNQNVNELIKQHQQAIEDLCRKYSVSRLELFGSAASGAFDPQSSDLDFLVEFLPLEEGRYADAYFNLLFDLEDLFGRPVDLVMPQAIRNRYFLQAVNRHREVLYAD